jgi:hypothetical protein
MSSIPALSNLDLSNQVSVLVAKKAMDAQRQQGEAAIQLLKAASESAPSEQGAADDSGGVDVYA